MAKKSATRPQVKTVWLPTAAAARILGIKPRKLADLRPELIKGHHWINVSGANAKRACYRWHLENLLAYFAQL